MAYRYTSSITHSALFGDILDVAGESLQKSKLYRLEQSIDWEGLAESIKDSFSIYGRANVGVRQMLGLEILKHIWKGMSDEELVEKLSTDMGVMWFCGIRNVNDPVKHIDSSSMTKFRNRIASIDGLIEKMQNVHIVTVVKQKVPNRKRGQYDQDSTVIEEKIAHPNDVNLLAKVVEVGARLVTAGKELVGKTREHVINNGKRSARKLQLSYYFGKEKGEEKIIEIKEGLIAIGKRAIAKMRVLKHDLESLGTQGNKKAMSLLNKRGKLIETGTLVLEQQKEMIVKKLKTVANRIVSIHKPKVRAIVKGKVGKAVEFGAKAQIGMIGGKVLMVVKHERENTHDSKTVKDGIEVFKTVRGKVPKEAGFDKGYRNKDDNDPYLEELGIKNGIQGSEKWKTNNKQTRKRLYNRRAFIEPMMNDIKNHRGSNKNLYKEGNAKIGLIMATMASNYVRLYI